MSERAIELLCLPPADEGGAKFILDLGTMILLYSFLTISGCGSGLSGSVLEENGHYWVGLDISKSMLGNVTFLLNHDIQMSPSNVR